MILTITPNPLLNYTIHGIASESGERRCEKLPFTVGGKGINVARMLKSFGQPATAITFAGGSSGSSIIEQLRQQGIPARFVRTAVETRIGIDVFPDGPIPHNWWIEHGGELTDREILEMVQLLREELPYARFVAMSGSIPGKGQRDFYEKILLAIKDFRGEIFIDAKGDPLRFACRHGGFFLKHNREEAKETFALDPFIPEQTGEFCRILWRHKIWGAMVTDGKNPVWLWDGTNTYLLEPAPAREVSAVGCGDATLAGLIYGRSLGMSVLQSALVGLAAGAADSECAGPCIADYPAVEKKILSVKVKSSESFSL
jgi:fructose-1-phosphate kinase PfkB-like protein